MRASLWPLALAGVLLTATFAACNCGGVQPLPSEEDGGVDAGLPEDAGEDAGSPGDGGLTDAGEADAGDSDAGIRDDGGTPVVTDGGVICYTASCAGKVYACGNCLDDDGDGLIDSQDPDCLGPCHNREDSFDLGIPGGGHGNCDSIECYYDSNSGRGNDGCLYSLTCDPLEPDPACAFSGQGVGQTAKCPAQQPPVCLDTCRAITPNGCDCFGCCEVPLEDGGTRDIFLGSEQSTGQACTLENAGDPTKCRACTRNPSCEKTCGQCQLCLGKDTLPPECFDGGVTLPDGGAIPDGGSAQCPGGEQPCGLAGQAACPANYFCLTGCCVVVIN